MQTRRRHVPQWVAPPALALLALSAQAALAAPRVAHALYEGCTDLGSPLTEHSCFHAQFGPYQTVAAAASSTGTAPNINTVHTQYTATLSAGGGSVSYRPARAGDWAVFSNPDVPLRVLDPAGQALPVQLTDATTGCAELPTARVYALSANTVYRLVFGPSSAASVNLVLERLADFESYSYSDGDSDGFGTPDDAFVTACAAPAGRVASDTDCDDTHASIHPSATEVANGIDDNCDGQIDEGTTPLVTYYRDADGDGFGNAALTQQGTSAPAGYVANGDDCDDAVASVNPNSSESANGRDDNCNGEIDEGLAPLRTYYRDADGDGFGNAVVAQEGTSAPAGYVANDDDCDDAAANLNPNATEIGNGLDDNCNGQVDEGLAPANNYYQDADGDGFGNAAVTQQGTSAPAGYVANHDDCNDAAANISPTAIEVANRVDDNCNGEVDEGTAPLVTYYPDLDGDSFGDTGGARDSTTPLPGYVTNDHDCDDGRVDVNPEAAEVCDGADNDCDGTIDNSGDPLAELAEHACLHAQNGPFESVTAAAEGTAGPDVSATHRAFTIALAAVGDTHSGEVSYTVSEGGDYALLLGGDVPLRVIDSAGQEVAPEREQPVSCSALRSLHLYELTAGDYRLVFGPTAEASVLLVAEAAHHEHEEGEEEEPVATRYIDADGDGFGDPDRPILGCEGGAGGVDNGDDCDDTNAQTNPGADDICDQLDNDCDGEVDSSDGVSACTSCDASEAIARTTYRPTHSQDAELALGEGGKFAIPASLPLTEGCALGQRATLSWGEQDAAGRCTYVGVGRRYKLISCTQRKRAGSELAASRVSLRVRGLALCGPTAVKLSAPSSCE